jgi:site-specific DNA-methyltransferase (adenine-specific)
MSSFIPDTIRQGDCIEILNGIVDAQGPVADLVFADPPFNIGFKYDVYEDTRQYDEYYQWTHDWMQAATRVLKPTGSFWVAIGDEYAAEVRMIGRSLGLTLRNWVIWHYTFGQNTKAKFARSHVHLFYFVKDPADFTFNDDAVRVFSDRQRVYRDKRANPKGKIPDDVWNVFPRVCGTYGEREGWHPCQMPTLLLNRIVRACSNVGDLVIDPFAGSGTTLVSAKWAGRHWLGTDVSQTYVAQGNRRLKETRILRDVVAGGKAWAQEIENELAATYAEAALATTTMLETPHLLKAFVGFFNDRLKVAGVEREYPAEEVWLHLEKLRAKGPQCPIIRVHAVEPSGKPRPLPDLPDHMPQKVKDRKHSDPIQTTHRKNANRLM